MDNIIIETSIVLWLMHLKYYKVIKYIVQNNVIKNYVRNVRRK